MRLKSCFIACQLICGILAANSLTAADGEFEINLVRNGNFEPGMDRQGPRDWTPYYAPWGKTNLYEFGRGNATFTEDGIILGRGQLFQLGDMKDDISPAYKFSCRMKTEGGKGTAVELKISGGSVSLSNTKPDVWEDLSTNVVSKGHYGFCITITVPEGVKLHISSVKVTADLKSAGDGQVLIAKGGTGIPAQGILLPAQPNWFEQLAAHELQVNTYLISGVVLPVFADGKRAGDEGYIRVASLKKMIADTPPPREQKSWWQKLTGKQSAPAGEPQANGFRITCRDGNVELTGGNDAGVLAGAMHLSELLGAKFYAPRVYTIATNWMLKIPAMDIARHPAFDRTSGPQWPKLTFMGWKYGYLHDESCVAPCGEASPPTGGINHPQLFLVPPFLYAQSHPEFYALVKEQRIEGFNTERLGGLAVSAYLHLCLSNPDMHKVVAERIGRLIEMYPQCKYISICQNDGSLWCECEKCRAWDVDENSKTDRMVNYANAIATLLQDKYPDHKLVIYAYGAKTEELPLKAKLHRNVQMWYVLWPSAMPMWHATFCDQNKRGLKLLDDWNALTSTNLWLGLYPVNTYENAEKLKLAVAKGIRGFHQCGLRGDFPEITLYTTGRLIWDPDADVEKMIDEMMPHLYGKAAPYMRSYFKMHHRLVDEMASDMDKWIENREKNAGMFKRMPFAYTEKALDALNKAELAADGNDNLLKQIQAEQFKIYYAYIHEYRAAHPAMSEEQFAHYAQTMAKLVEVARQCRIQHARYKEPFTEWLYQTTEGTLDFDRDPSKWFKDKKIDLFLTDPVKTLKTRVYFQEKIINGWELPPKAFFGAQYYEKYRGTSTFVIRRQSSPIPSARTCLRLDALPSKEVELHLQGMDNDKEEKAEIIIKINNHEIFAGPVGFPKNKWGRQTYKVPREYLQTGENVIVIENITGDYKADMLGQAGPAEEALAKNYNWGWCMVSSVKFVELP